MPLANLPNDSRFAVPRRDGVEEASRLCHLSIETPTFPFLFQTFTRYTISTRNPNYSDSLVHRVPIIRVRECRKSIEIKSMIRSGTIRLHLLEEGEEGRRYSSTGTRHVGRELLWRSPGFDTHTPCRLTKHINNDSFLETPRHQPFSIRPRITLSENVLSPRDSFFKIFLFPRNF